MGLVAGVAAMLGASLDRLKLRVEALEKTPRVMVSVKRGAGSAADGWFLDVVLLRRWLTVRHLT
jgi:hypothetical protein